jgi:hypothetical protein
MKINPLVLFLPLLFLAFTAAGQQRALDSLRTLQVLAKHDTTRLALLVDAGLAFYNASQPDSALATWLHADTVARVYEGKYKGVELASIQRSHGDAR